MKQSAIKALDGYKTGHMNQYPAGTEFVYSNITARSGKHSNTDLGGVVFFGLQGFMKWFLQDMFNDTFFNADVDVICSDYQRRMNNYLGKDVVTTEHIRELHGMGYLPIEIRALPEGSLVPYGVPMMTIINTDKRFYWLTNYLETIISAETWKSINSATTAYAYRKEFTRHAKLTGSPMDFVNWQGHDFSFRGMGGLNDATVSGAAHLTSFYGTDTVPAIDYLENYYDANSDEEIVGGSVPATEHSVMCMGGKEDEIETFRRLITETYPSGIVSIVSDTWDFWKVMTEYLPALKDEIMARNGRVVIRPDSGNPVDIICGNIPGGRVHKIPDSWRYSDEEYVRNVIIYGDRRLSAPGDTAVFIFTSKEKMYKATATINDIERAPECDAEFTINLSTATIVIEDTCINSEIKGAYEILWDVFGGTVNEDGYKVLDTHIGLIYGDSITIDSQKEILGKLEAKGFCASNLVLGIGSYTYTYCTRDTHGMAVKATWGVVNGEEREIFKDPITDDGLKKSAKGLLAVWQNELGQYYMKDQQSRENECSSCLRTVFFNGMIMNEVTLSDVRETVNSINI